MARDRIVIVGAGIVGCHSALQISKERPQAEIVIVDRDPYSYAGASSGNMGGFATCEVQPLATVGNLFRGLKWMMQPLAPFTLRPRCFFSLRPWLARFVRSALTPGHYDHVVSAQADLMRSAHAAHLDAIGDTPLRNLISDEGAIVVYRNKNRQESDWNRRWRLFRENGEECELLDNAALHERLPGLDDSIRLGVHIPGIRHWTSPAGLLRGLHELLQKRGVSICQDEVSTIETDAGHPRRLRLSNDRRMRFDKLVVAAGAWSKSLCQEIGDNVPLDSERGYSTTIQGSGVALKHLLLFPDDEFVATPMSEGLRLGGTVELASLDAPANFSRTDILARTIRDYFPAVDISERDEWMGHRPSMPDGLPVIGRSPSASNVFYAFGHGHVGVTQSAITARLLTSVIMGRDPEIDVAPFSIERFT